jgi:O-antigen/teichoic acid export membrane protein
MSIFKHPLILKLLHGDLGEVVKGVILYSGVSVGSMVLSYGTLWIITNVYGAESLGLLSLGIAVSSLFMFVFMFGMPNGAILHFAHHLGSTSAIRRTLFRRYLILTVGFSFIAALMLILFANNAGMLGLKDERVIKSLIIFGYLMPIICVQRLLISCFMGIKRIGQSTAIMKFVPSVCNLVVLLVSVLFLQRMYLVPVYVHAIALTLTVVVGYFMWERASASLVDGLESEPPPVMSEILKVSFPMMITGSMLLLLRWTDTVVLGMYRPVEDVGIYQIALRIANFPTFIFMAVSSIAAPKFAELYKSGDITRVRETAWHASRLISGISIPLFIGIAVAPGFLLGIFGTEFRGAEDVLLLLLVSAAATSISGLVGPFLNMTGHQRIISVIMAGGALLNLILNLLWIPTMGARGAALATCVSTIGWNAAATLLIWKMFGFTLGFKLPILRRSSKK